MSTGYSKTPLWKKIGYKENCVICLINPYDEYLHDLELSFKVEMIDEIIETEDHSVDLIHYFSNSREELQNIYKLLLTKLNYQGSLWVSWPKTASKVLTDLDGNIVREICLRFGLVDVKVAAINSIWSGLKFMYRKEDRQSS